MLELLTRQIATLVCPPPTASLCFWRAKEDLSSGRNNFFSGQRKIDFTMLFLRMCLLFLHLIYMTSRYLFYICTL